MKILIRPCQQNVFLAYLNDAQCLAKGAKKPNSMKKPFSFSGLHRFSFYLGLYMLSILKAFLLPGPVLWCLSWRLSFYSGLCYAVYPEFPKLEWTRFPALPIICPCLLLWPVLCCLSWIPEARMNAVSSISNNWPMSLFMHSEKVKILSNKVS